MICDLVKNPTLIIFGHSLLLIDPRNDRQETVNRVRTVASDDEIPGASKALLGSIERRGRRLDVIYHPTGLTIIGVELPLRKRSRERARSILAHEHGALTSREAYWAMSCPQENGEGKDSAVVAYETSPHLTTLLSAVEECGFRVNAVVPPVMRLAARDSVEDFAIVAMDGFVLAFSRSKSKFITVRASDSMNAIKDFVANAAATNKAGNKRVLLVSDNLEKGWPTAVRDELVEFQQHSLSWGQWLATFSINPKDDSNMLKRPFRVTLSFFLGCFAAVLFMGTVWNVGQATLSYMEYQTVSNRMAIEKEALAVELRDSERSKAQTVAAEGAIKVIATENPHLSRLFDHFTVCMPTSMALRRFEYVYPNWSAEGVIVDGAKSNFSGFVEQAMKDQPWRLRAKPVLGAGTWTIHGSFLSPDKVPR